MSEAARGSRLRGRTVATVVGLCVVSLVIGFGIGAAIWAGGDDTDDASEPASARADEAEADEAAGDGDDGGDDPVGPPVAPDDPDGQPAVIEADVQPEVVRSQAGDATERTFHWDYRIPAGSAVLLPAFTCPEEARYVKENGTVRKGRILVGDRGRDVDGWRVADVRVEASSGVGYAAFNRAVLADGGDRDMLGWEQGTILSNSIWAPVFEGGTADVSVSCTSDQNRAAWVRATFDPVRLFPWVP